MPNEPRVEQRDPQTYVAIPASVTMETFPAAADRTFPELFGWLGAHGVEPAGPPFIRYLRVEMDRELEIEFGAPVAGEVEPDGAVRIGVLPGGRYATLLHVGPYSDLVAANSELQQWAERNGIRWAVSDDGVWSGRVEHYLTDPAAEPDSSRWETEVAYLAAGD